MEVGGGLSFPFCVPSRTWTEKQSSNKGKALFQPFPGHLSCPEQPPPHPLRSQGSCNFNKLQQRAHALPHHSLAYFLAVIVQSLLHFPPSVGCAPFTHSSMLKSQSSDPGGPAGDSASFPKYLPLESSPWCLTVCIHWPRCIHSKSMHVCVCFRGKSWENLKTHWRPLTLGRGIRGWKKGGFYFPFCFSSVLHEFSHQCPWITLIYVCQ